MQKLEIKTRQVLNVWYCTVTYRGYDYMEKGLTPEEAQSKMRTVIGRNGWSMDKFHFSEPATQEQIVKQARQERKNIHTQTTRLDRKPFNQ